LRARLLTACPVLSKEFGIHPWDYARLSVAELNQYLDALREMAQAARRAH